MGKMNETTIDRKTPAGEEERRVAALLQEAAREPVPKLPTAAQVWWRAEVIRALLTKEKAAKRAAWPALWGQGIALGAWGLTLTWGISTAAANPAGTSAWVAMAAAVAFVPVAGAVVLFVFAGES